MQVAFPIKAKLLSLPTMGYAVPDARYQGPRITKTPITVAHHVNAYYWFCLVLIGLLVMGILGSIAVGVSIKDYQSLCPVMTDIPTFLGIFGITDICFFFVILVVVILRACCCANWPRLCGCVAVILFTIFCLAFLLYAILGLIVSSQNIFKLNFQSDNQSRSNYCNQHIRNYTILLIILICAGFLIPIIYIFILLREQCQRRNSAKGPMIYPLRP